MESLNSRENSCPWNVHVPYVRNSKKSRKNLNPKWNVDRANVNVKTSGSLINPPKLEQFHSFICIVIYLSGITVIFEEPDPNYGMGL